MIATQRTPAERARHASHARDGRNRDPLLGHPTTSEIEYTKEETEFMDAVREFQHRTGRRFPTWREVLGVARSLGYRCPRWHLD